jgi:acetylornithine deacetylase/succinyl-diaminopimelate desuccinylase-like protein
LSYLQIDLVGPKGDLHSGSFGGSVHNPIQALTEIVASLHDKNGKITIPGFYKDVLALTKKERDAFKKLPWNDKKYAKELGVAQLYGEKGFTTLERLWARPTLECNGIWGGFIGEGAKTVLPSKASAKISMRLVPHQKSAKVAKLFEKHIKKIAPKTVKVTVQNLHGGEAAITPIDSPGVKAAVAALEKGFTTLERLWARPTLECNGIWGGFTGVGAKTVLPSKASAKISMRLVPHQKSAKVAKLFEKHIKKIAPKTVKVTIHNLHGGEAAITPIDSPGVRAAVSALEKGFKKKPLYQREGGSIPIVVDFKQILGLDTVLLGFGLPDENAHAPNEFINLDNFFGGMRTVAHLFNELPNYLKKK